MAGWGSLTAGKIRRLIGGKAFIAPSRADFHLLADVYGLASMGLDGTPIHASNRRLSRELLNILGLCLRLAEWQRRIEVIEVVVANVLQGRGYAS